MDAVVLAAAFWRLMGTNDFAAVAAVLAEDFILDWPQSRYYVAPATRTILALHPYNPDLGRDG